MRSIGKVTTAHFTIILTYDVALQLKISKYKYESGVTEEAAIKVLVQVRIDSINAPESEHFRLLLLWNIFKSLLNKNHDPFGTKYICINY